jgi:hypothetical protein
MKKPTACGTPSKARTEKPGLRRMRLYYALLLFVTAFTPVISRAQSQQRPAGSEPSPELAVPAILATFDSYEVVAMPEAHGLKDLDDFILSLIRNPAFSAKVNDIAVECGNPLYQPILDRYIAGEDVPFTEVRKVWRNAQLMCGMSGFFEQFFPLVRTINQKLPAGKRLRVLAADSPVDWDQIGRSLQNAPKLPSRDVSIASVMEKEVLSKHRKALMLFGTLHLLHSVGDSSAVSIYEKDYPNRTFVISELGVFDTELPTLSSGPLTSWPIPSLARAKGTWLGSLDLNDFVPAFAITSDCNVYTQYPKELQRPIADLVDAFLYLGPQDLRLNEQMPADIALDVDYMTELQRRASLAGFPGAIAGSLKEFEEQIVNSAENPLIVQPKTRDPNLLRQKCLDLKGRGNAQ